MVKVLKSDLFHVELINLNGFRTPFLLVLLPIVSWTIMSSLTLLVPQAMGANVLAETIDGQQLPTAQFENSTSSPDSAIQSKQRLQQKLVDRSTPATQQQSLGNLDLITENSPLPKQSAAIAKARLLQSMLHQSPRVLDKAKSIENSAELIAPAPLRSNFTDIIAQNVDQSPPREQPTPGIVQPNSSAPTVPQPVPPTSTDRSPLVPVAPANPVVQNDPRYLIAPRNVDLNLAAPLGTQIVIDEVPFTHRSQFEITGGVDLGDRRSTNPGFNATALGGASIQESVSKDRIYRLDYRSLYGRARFVRQNREITTSTVAPETALGNRQQTSFVADCLPGISTTPATNGQPQICTYIPGLKTDESSINPQTLIPTRFLNTSKFGDVVTPESLIAMRSDGFQAGANGQQLGVDLYFPLVGTIPGNSQGTQGTVDRYERVTDTPAITAGRMRQVVLTNGRDNALGRTIRGFSYVGGNENLALNSGLQLLTEALPDAEPSLSPGEGGKSVGISRNLFLAANNNRIPENSFTAYSGGIGHSKTPDAKNSLPTANYNGVWIGLSPIVTRQVLSSTSYQTTGPERITLQSGGEGGVENNVNVLAAINTGSFNSAALTNAYSQVYLTFYERDVNTFNSVTLKEKTTYQPHVSFSGNVTTADSALRYYSGAILSTGIESQPDKVHGYVGGDFTSTGAGGLSYGLAAIGYINPTAEYYSRVGANVAQKVNLGRNPSYNLVFSSGFNYALDGNSSLDALQFRAANTFLNVGTTANLGNVSVGASYFIPTGLPNQIDSLLSTNISWRIVDGMVLSGYYTPINTNITRSTLGASASMRLGKDYNSPTLSLSWSRNEIDFGGGVSKIGYADNVYGIYFRFGAPANPFTLGNR
jgi:hypothetical protein